MKFLYYLCNNGCYSSGLSSHCVKSVLMWSFFWSVFFRIRTVSSNAGKYGPEETPYLKPFHPVSARSALFTIVHNVRFCKLFHYPFISKFLKGIYNKHSPPALPCYVNNWDISILLAYFESLRDNFEATLNCLTEKLTAA